MQINDYILWREGLACDCGSRVSKILKIKPQRGADLYLNCLGCNEKGWHYTGSMELNLETGTILPSKTSAKVLLLYTDK